MENFAQVIQLWIQMFNRSVSNILRFETQGAQTQNKIIFPIIILSFIISINILLGLINILRRKG